MRKRTRPKENYHVLQRRGFVKCPRCTEDVYRGPNSNPVDELFLKAHQACDQKCRNMPMLMSADEEFRGNDMLDHVDFEADRYDYDNDDDETLLLIWIINRL